MAMALPALLLAPLLLPGCAAIALGVSARSRSWTLEPEAGGCREAAEGSLCHHAITFLKEGGFEKHPDWYPGLSSSSSFGEVQAALHSLGKANCTKPCGASSVLFDALVHVPSHSQDDCHDTKEGEWCYKALIWLKTDGLRKHPNWYPDLHENSSMAEFQAEAHRQGKVGCPRPCTATSDKDASALDEIEQPSSDCKDVDQGTCYIAITWAKDNGVRKHPEWYPGLTGDSALSDFQEHMFLRNKHDCPRPCSSTEKGTRRVQESLNCLTNGLCRRKMPVEAMNVDQLDRYLSGTWDGLTQATRQQADAWAAVAKQVRAAGRQTSETSSTPPEVTTMESTSTPLPVRHFLEVVATTEGPAAQIGATAEPLSHAVERPIAEESHAKLAKVEMVDDEPLPMVNATAMVEAPGAQIEATPEPVSQTVETPAGVESHAELAKAAAVVNEPLPMVNETAVAEGSAAHIEAKPETVPQASHAELAKAAVVVDEPLPMVNETAAVGGPAAQIEATAEPLYQAVERPIAEESHVDVAKVDPVDDEPLPMVNEEAAELAEALVTQRSSSDDVQHTGGLEANATELEVEQEQASQQHESVAQ